MRCKSINTIPGTRYQCGVSITLKTGIYTRVTGAYPDNSLYQSVVVNTLTHRQNPVHGYMKVPQPYRRQDLKNDKNKQTWAWEARDAFPPTVCIAHETKQAYTRKLDVQTEQPTVAPDPHSTAYSGCCLECFLHRTKSTVSREHREEHACCLECRLSDYPRTCR